MSRIGKQPIVIPPKVKVEVKGQKVFVEGPKGKLDWELPRRTTLKIENDKVVISRNGDDAEAKALHGLSRALVNNMVSGVSEGFVKKLEIQGVAVAAAADTHRVQHARHLHRHFVAQAALAGRRHDQFLAVPTEGQAPIGPTAAVEAQLGLQDLQRQPQLLAAPRLGRLEQPGGLLAAAVDPQSAALSDSGASGLERLEAGPAAAIRSRALRRG
ncbi:MAG: 50S ribosomal protein L6, partial [Verrucomicrobiota bacterium]